jgi:hypothetical protein
LKYAKIFMTLNEIKQARGPGGANVAAPSRNLLNVTDNQADRSEAISVKKIPRIGSMKKSTTAIGREGEQRTADT